MPFIIFYNFVGCISFCTLITFCPNFLSPHVPLDVMLYAQSYDETYASACIT